MTSLDGVQKVVSGVVDARDDVGVTLGIGSPHDDHFVETIFSLEVPVLVSTDRSLNGAQRNLPNVGLDLLHVSPGSLRTLEDVVGTVLLVGSDEVRVVDTGQGLQLGHLLANKLLESRLKDLGTVHGVSKVHAADVPAANDKIIGVDHRQHVIEGNVDLLAGLGVGSKLDSRAHDKRTIVIGSTRTFLGLPSKVLAVGDNTSSHGGTVVTTPADHHQTNLADLTVDLELIVGRLGGGDKLTIRGAGDIGSMISIATLDFIVGVLDVGRVDGKQRGASSMGGPVHGAIGSNIRICVGSHCVQNFGSNSGTIIDVYGGVEDVRLT